MLDSKDSPRMIAEAVYHQVFRTGFSEPGFAMIDLGADCSSETQRRLMVSLKNEFSRLENIHRGRELIYQSLTRFDQQVTTKPHRDGGPDESILMLGYEPSLIESRLEMSDYSRCAHDLGLTPAEFLDRFNPMFADGRDRLAPHTVPVRNFDNTSFQIVIINNSLKRFGDGLVGVLHTATIITPNSDLKRVINSTMLAVVPCGEQGDVEAQKQSDFLTTNVIHRPAYG